MAEDVSVADPSVILDLIESFRRSKTMFAAVALGVFDALDSGTKSVPELARELTADVAALERLLEGCVSLELVQREGNRYGNTAIASTYLCHEWHVVLPKVFGGNDIGKKGLACVDGVCQPHPSRQGGRRCFILTKDGFGNR